MPRPKSLKPSHCHHRPTNRGYVRLGGKMTYTGEWGSQAGKDALLARWYRDEIRARTLELIAKWELILGVKVKQLFVQQMKTKWGSCNSCASTIRLNTELAKKPLECLEYIVVHEMIHLLEPTHNARFVALMDQSMPRWQFLRQKLNRLPVRHVDWDY